MNREEILAMKPGCELDKIVSEKVMNIFDDGNRIAVTSKGETSWKYWEPKQYSKSIEAAWEVVEKLKIKGLYMAFAMHIDTYNFSVWDSEGVELITDWVRCETAPEAICKSALLAVIGVEK